LLNAKDLNEAIALAGTIPPVKFGCIQVRSVRGLGLAAAA